LESFSSLEKTGISKGTWRVCTSASIVLGMLVFTNLLMKAKLCTPAAEHPKMNLKEIMMDKPYLNTV